MSALEIPRHILRALEADDSGPLDEIIRARRPENWQALRAVVVADEMPLELRRKAIYALGRWGDPEATPAIQRAVPRLDERGHIAAIDALGRLGTEDALETIEQFRDDPSPQIRKFVVKALSRIGGTRARVTLDAMADKDPEEWLRKLAREEKTRLARP